MALQTKTITGTTNLPTLWSHKLEVVENSIDVNSNTSSVTVTAYIGVINRTSSYMNGAEISCVIKVTGCNDQTINWSGNSGTIYNGNFLNIGSKTFSVPHNDNGYKSITITSNFTNDPQVRPQSGNASGDMDLSFIARKSTVSCSNANIGENATIDISRKSASFTHTLTYEFGNLTGTIATKTSSTSLSWTLPNDFYAQTPNSNEKTGRIYCTTYNGSSSIGTTQCDFKAYVTNANPDTSNLLLEVFDSNSVTVNLTGNQDIMIKGYSTLHVRKHTNAVAQKSATMREYKLENEVQPYSSGIQDFEIVKYSKNGFTFYSTDSRGNSSSTPSVFPYIVDYFDITKGNISLSRSQGGVGESVTLNYNGSFWNGNFGIFSSLSPNGVNNSDNLIATYRYKKTTSNRWIDGETAVNPTINSNNYSFSGLIDGDTQTHGFSINDSYDFEVTISDSLSTVTFSLILGTGKPAIAVFGNKVSLGDKYDTSLGGIQLWGDIYINGNRIS